MGNGRVMRVFVVVRLKVKDGSGKLQMYCDLVPRSCARGRVAVIGSVAGIAGVLS